jgi:nucleotide-binding universal stress UspA family protein
MANGPLIIAYDGTRSSERAIRDAAELVGRRPALVTVVWKAGLAFELMGLPTATLGLPPAPIDIRTALEIDERASENARRLAQQGADLARELGMDAEGLAVAEDPEITVAETLVRLARERDASAIAIALHGDGRGGSVVVIGSTSRDVIRHAPCPVVVASRDGN